MLYTPHRMCAHVCAAMIKKKITFFIIISVVKHNSYELELGGGEKKL